MSICNIKCHLILAKWIWQSKNFSASPYNLTVMTMVLSNQYISRRACIKSTNIKFQWHCFKSPEWHSWMCHPTNKSLGKIDAIKCTDNVSGPSKIRFVAICSITSCISLESHTKTWWWFVLFGCLSITIAKYLVAEILFLIHVCAKVETAFLPLTI